MHPLHGPHKIATNGQLVIPKEVLNAAGLAPGDLVYVQSADNPTEGIVVIPVETASRWLVVGRAQEEMGPTGSRGA